jgi:hypothetical protein
MIMIDQGITYAPPPEQGGRQAAIRASYSHEQSCLVITCVIQLGELPAKGMLQLDAHAPLLRNLAGDLHAGRKEGYY